MDVSDYRILQVIYLTLENTKLERQQMSPFQFRRLIIEALQSRTYTVDVMPGHQRMFVVDSLVILFSLMNSKMMYLLSLFFLVHYNPAKLKKT